jgi:hypothetical protein
MTMKKWRGPVIILILIMLFSVAIRATVNTSFCLGNPRKIDVFTDKVPFDGKGINNASDTFQPQELVRLYALVTYNEAPVANKLVAFQVLNPLNMTVAVAANITNDDGITTFCFRIPWPSEDVEQTIFGKWFVIATVDIAGEVVMDTLTFKVGWLVQVISLKTLDIELKPKTDFTRGEKIIFDLKVENSALTLKNATIMIDVQDSADYPVMHVEEIHIFQPSENNIQIVSEIPTTASIGKAIISVAAYTAPPKFGGVPYSPPFSSQFNIIMPVKYYLTVRTEPFGITSIPGEGWYNEGTAVLLTAPETVPVSTGVRYKFSYWDVDGVTWMGNPITVVMNKNHTSTAHYVLQYYLSVKTSPVGIAVIPGEGWYDAYVNVTLSAPPVKGYDFNYWDVDGFSKPAGVYQIIVYMDGPHAATAHYSARWIEWLYLVLLVILILLITLLCILAYRRIKRRRKAGEEDFYRGWTAWYYGYNLREKSRRF